MKNITDEDLILLYYGEHDDPTLAATVAGSAELTARFEAMSAELGRVDDFIPPERNDDYGSDVWRRISPQLTARPAKPASAWTAWLPGFKQPRFSWAGAMSLVLVASLAFMLGRQGSTPDDLTPVSMESAQITALAGLNAERLLTSSVSGHLEDLNLAFTEFALSTEAPSSDAGKSMDLLVANRLYRQAAVVRGDHQLAAFLSGLEPVLIELAHKAHLNSPATLNRMQHEIRDTHLFRIRIMNNQLETQNIST